jgi:quercetin dioxygenase-like cupin family protein
MATDQPLTVHTSDPNVMSTPEPGLRRHVMSHTPEMMLVRHTMEPGWTGARHSHPHQQLLYIVSGHIILTTPDATLHLRTGDSTIVPGNVEHQATAPIASEVLDVALLH